MGRRVFRLAAAVVTRAAICGAALLDQGRPGTRTCPVPGGLNTPLPGCRF
jgi:hypothetical protein